MNQSWVGGVWEPLLVEGGGYTFNEQIKLYHYRLVFIGVIHENSAVYDAMLFAANKANAFSNVSVVFKSINTTKNTNLLNQGNIFVCVHFSRLSSGNNRIPWALGHMGHDSIRGSPPVYTFNCLI